MGVVRKLSKRAPADLKRRVDAVAVLADEIWREHFTPIIGTAQVEYMLAKFQSAERIFADITENGYVYFTVSDTVGNTDKDAGRDTDKDKGHDMENDAGGDTDKDKGQDAENDAGGGGLVGYCGVVPGEDFLLISKLYIHAGRRGRGYGRRLFDEAVELCRQEYGFDKIRLTVNKYNQKTIDAYVQMGFQTVDSVKTDIGGGFFMDDFVMELSIE